MGEFNSDDHYCGQESRRRNGVAIIVNKRVQNAVLGCNLKSKGEKERYKHLNAEFQRIARRDKKAYRSEQCKEI